MNTLSAKIKHSIRYTKAWQAIGEPIRSHKQIQAWIRAGQPSPPPHVIKVRNIIAIADLFGIHVLVETGTYKGHMIQATKERFKSIYSIEIYPPLAAAAQKNFAAYPHITIVEGDSREKMPKILTDTPEPVLFWLDGHYSGQGTGGAGQVETPIVEELKAIAELRPERRDAIIIDDARCFTGEGGYPNLSDLLQSAQGLFKTTPLVANDAIFILPH